MQFNVGDVVEIPCSVGPGAFSGERLITIELDGNPLSGFVQANYVRESGDRGIILGRIKDVTDQTVTIQLPGSYFTTAVGMASVSSVWATTHLQRKAQVA